MGRRIAEIKLPPAKLVSDPSVVGEGPGAAAGAHV